MFSRKYVWLITMVMLSINSCKENGVGPGKSNPGRRDYVWNIDTIKTPSVLLYSLFGTIPDNLWAVGPSGGLDQTIWHFDGTNWKTDNVSRNLTPLSIFGFADDNIWLGGMDGKIWNYDGDIWKESVHFSSSKNIGFEDIWGNSPNNIFAVGYSGYDSNRVSIIAHFDGNKWELNELSELNFDLLRIRKKPQQNIYFLTGLQTNKTGNDRYAVFEYDGIQNIKSIYEGSNGQESWTFIQLISNDIYFGIGTNIYKYVNDNFKLFLDVNDENFWTGFYGRSENDLFLVMSDGIKHYNGTDIEYLYHSSHTMHILSAILFDSEVFFLAIDPSIGKNIIIRGKLN